jgi:hypothetical protein
MEGVEFAFELASPIWAIDACILLVRTCRYSFDI